MAEKVEAVKAKNSDTSDLDTNLDRKKMFTDLWWLEYCCCTGVGIGSMTPFLAAESRNLCIHQKTQCTDFGNPFCSGVAVNCCITSQCAFPKVEDSPTCVCCNKKLAGSDAAASGSKWKPKLFDWTLNWADQFWLYYFLCGGVSVHGFNKGGRPCFGLEEKQLCIKQGQQCVMPPAPDNIACQGLSTVCCFWSEMQIPPKFGETPKIACCGFMMNKDLKNKGKPCEYGNGEATV